ncbi:DUF1850 domain-containing protein [Yoonia vestfoldensis]|uniref:DUF1850 domain-containing protein n=1 Tax=Yoonia vestfoldensis TaxID=245188 RepID=A0A1Y0E8Y9_9RHOB|nr:DUF1850 domain-containing protein [Yoonia vestfoldensis]ART99878.1 hypothetical protein LOKVESSMR4R_00541 [Yoonia vestfoldensis]
MMAIMAGRHICVALLFTTLFSGTPSLAQPLLVVETTGPPLGELPFRQGEEICLTWNHSVTGGAVADCFENIAGKLTLTRSFLHDFAAGLGEVAGRGRIIPSPTGGYWIVDIAEPIPGNTLALRVGSTAVDHRLTGTDQSLRLSRMAPQTAVRLTLYPD